MMKLLRILILMLLILTLKACKNGAETLPELAGEIFEALKDNNRKDLLKTAPSLSGYEEAYMMIYANKYPDKAELKKEATDKAVSMRLNLTSNFNELMKTAQDEKKLDWATTKIRDLKYTVKDKKEGYQEAKMRMIVETGVEKNVVLFDAIKVDKRWYLVENLRWEE
ncbi:MAG: hypothetical protein ACXWEY_08325 [Bacteroidia bacterium]